MSCSLSYSKVMTSSKVIVKLILIFVLSTTALFFFNNCSAVNNNEQSSVVLQSNNCDTSGAPSSLRTPNTIDEVVQLINALPKPLTIDCFIKALQKPLQIYAVNNRFSAQPAVSLESPRIFIVNGQFTMSVVPAGMGYPYLEVSQYVSSSLSIKGEFEFPILTQITPDTPYSSILDNSLAAIGGSTSCRSCHSNEAVNASITTGLAYNSNIIRPDPTKRVLQSYMLYQSTICNSSNSNEDRCKMLKAIFQDGEAQDITDFP